MSLIVAARFTTFPAAEDAAQRVITAGFVEEDVTLFFVNPSGQHGFESISDANAREAPEGAEIGVTVGAVAGVGIFVVFSPPLIVSLIAIGVSAYVGSLVGAMARTREASNEETRESGVLVAVHVTPDSQLD